MPSASLSKFTRSSVPLGCVTYQSFKKLVKQVPSSPYSPPTEVSVALKMVFSQILGVVVKPAAGAILVLTYFEVPFPFKL